MQKWCWRRCPTDEHEARCSSRVTFSQSVSTNTIAKSKKGKQVYTNRIHRRVPDRPHLLYIIDVAITVHDGDDLSHSIHIQTNLPSFIHYRLAFIMYVYVK